VPWQGAFACDDPLKQALNQYINSDGKMIPILNLWTYFSFDPPIEPLELQALQNLYHPSPSAAF